MPRGRLLLHVPLNSVPENLADIASSHSLKLLFGLFELSQCISNTYPVSLLLKVCQERFIYCLSCYAVKLVETA
jgi:hypothetical protein